MVVVGIFLKGQSQAATESGEVCTSLDRVDIVDVGVDILVEVGVVGQRHLDGHSVALGVEVDDIFDQRLFACIDIFHELLEAFIAVEHILVRIALFVKVAKIGEGQRNAGIEERQVAETIGECVVVVDRLAENGGIRMEDDCGAGVVGFADHFQLAGRLAVCIFLHVDLAISMDLGTKIV